jgi:hypothetical protein
MAANTDTGLTRTVRYCGHEYTVQPGQQYGRKQAWLVYRDGVQITHYTPTRSKAVHAIHEDAVALGSYTTSQADGLTYDRLVGALCR